MSITVSEILAKWPDRQAVLEDARVAQADLDIVAVHRWFQRGSVPARFWGALIDGATRRDLHVTADDFVRVHDKRPVEQAERGAA